MMGSAKVRSGSTHGRHLSVVICTVACNTRLLIEPEHGRTLHHALVEILYPREGPRATSI